MNPSDVATIAEQTAKRELGATNVDRVAVFADQDADGDDIWRILVVLRDPGPVNRKFSGFIRHLIQDFGPNQPFPVVSFRSVSDDRDFRSEAA